MAEPERGAVIVVDENPIRRVEKGRFTPGQRGGPGRPKGSISRVNRQVKEEIAADIASGVIRHPVRILIDIANDPDLPWGLRRAAAADAAPYIMPIKFNVEVETAEVDQTVEIERIRTTLSSITGAK